MNAAEGAVCSAYMWAQVSNTAVLSPNSKPAFPSSPAELPGPPQLLEVTDIDKESVTLSWKKPAKEGGAPILSYIVEKRDGKAATWTRVADTGFATHVFSVDGLIEGYEYFFQVRAKNSAGIGEPATLESAVVPSKRKGQRQFLKIVTMFLCAFWRWLKIKCTRKNSFWLLLML